MSKPDDIPQDVWDEVLRLWRDDEADPGEVIIARAIMAAKAGERAGCIADAEAERDENASGEGEVYIAERLIAAIRKRGEA